MKEIKKSLDELFYLILKVPKSKNKDNLSFKNVKHWDSVNHINLILSRMLDWNPEYKSPVIIIINITKNIVLNICILLISPVYLLSQVLLNQMK